MVWTVRPPPPLVSLSPLGRSQSPRIHTNAHPYPCILHISPPPPLSSAEVPSQHLISSCRPRFPRAFLELTLDQPRLGVSRNGTFRDLFCRPGPPRVACSRR